ncbi:MAG: hypothetical protein H8E12_08440 [Rhodobacteraceae bacterium]|nr:hypothetical protein [Paracoccaceae bacterium]
MQKLIIWEGCDGCGKTNIAAAVSERLGIPVYKSGLEDQMFHDKDSQYLVLRHGNYEMIKLLDVTNSNVMFDRFFPSEWVYSQVFDRQQDLDTVLALDKYWSQLGGKIIWLDKPNIEENDELVPRSKYNEIRKKYKEYMKLTKCDVLYLDTTDRDLEKQVDLISKFIIG